MLYCFLNRLLECMWRMVHLLMEQLTESSHVKHQYNQHPDQEVESFQHSWTSSWWHVRFRGHFYFLSFVHLANVYPKLFCTRHFPRVLFCCCFFLLGRKALNIWGVSSGLRSCLAEYLTPAAYQVIFIDRCLCNLWFQIFQREQWRGSANCSAWLCIDIGESQPKAPYVEHFVQRGDLG